MLAYSFQLYGFSLVVYPSSSTEHGPCSGDTDRQLADPAKRRVRLTLEEPDHATAPRSALPCRMSA